MTTQNILMESEHKKKSDFFYQCHIYKSQA